MMQEMLPTWQCRYNGFLAFHLRNGDNNKQRFRNKNELIKLDLKHNFKNRKQTEGANCGASVREFYVAQGLKFTHLTANTKPVLAPGALNKKLPPPPPSLLLHKHSPSFFPSHSTKLVFPSKSIQRLPNSPDRKGL